MALKRYIALVIGNSQYDSPYYGNLTNPTNDADAMGIVLKKLKCTVFVKKNLTYSGYGVAFDEFTQEIINQKADAAIVYFAGHGLNIDATDYLIMKDTPAFKTGESKTKKESVAINNICQELNAIGDQLNILILDACRDNPNQSTRGLISNPKNSLLGIRLTNHLPFQTFIAYSTSIGKSASDGNAAEGHSPYTKTLLENIEEENLPIESLFKRVRNSVYKGYDNLQLPWEYSCLTEEFCFNYGQLNPYFDKPYSEAAYNDGTYVSQNDGVNEIINGLKSYTYDAQNTAVDKLHRIYKIIMDKNDFFVIGRNLLQAAHGGAFECQNEISYTNLRKYTWQGENHVLNGILYEMYFDKSNQFRDSVKGTNMLDNIANVLLYPEFKNACKFIQMSLVEYKDRLYYTLGSSDRCIVAIKLGSSYMNMFDETVWRINTILIKGEEIPNPIPFNHELDAVELRRYIQQAIAIPSLCLQIRYSENINEGDLFIYNHLQTTEYYKV